MASRTARVAEAMLQRGYVNLSNGKMLVDMDRIALARHARALEAELKLVRDWLDR